jgi:hypothetical protein
MLLFSKLITQQQFTERQCSCFNHNTFIFGFILYCFNLIRIFMKRTLSLLLFTSSIFSMQLDLIKKEQVFAPSRLGEVELYHGEKGFHVLKDDKKYVIQKYFTDPIVRDITKEQLNAFLESGHLSLNQMNDGEYSLKAKGRVNGGGPLFGKFMYWTTKTLCYAVLAAGVGAIAITGGTAVAGKSSKRRSSDDVSNGEVIEAMVQTASGAVILNAGINEAVVTSGAGATMGVAGVVASGLAKAGYAPVCAKVTTAALASGSSSGGIVAGIEALSLTVGLFFGFTPTP